ncbi:MAG: hypothetical protein JWM12_1777 [Ilumatobacteraceae bacterium]|nr:hypothetical protein [Ilumatobacteraceae bacterium]
MISTRRSSALLATLTVVTLVAGACGSDATTKTTASTPGAIVNDTTAATSAGSGASTTTTGGSTTTTGGSTSATTAGSTGATTGSTSPGSSDLANHAVTDTAGAPVHGGTLVFGIDSDSANPWAPYRVSCAGSCFFELQGVSDSLFGLNDKGEVVPILLTSVDHNADFTEWTLHIRDGIKFQDGTPLDGDAVKFNIDTCLDSPLTASAYAAIDKTTASGQDVVITTKGGPWVALPAYYAYSSCGYMFSKQWLSSLADVPQRNPKAVHYDAALAATAANGDPAKPVGLGAFTFQSYTPGNGNSFKATKNPDYWRGPNGITGEDLPYLDGIEGVAYVDADSRSNAVRSGDIDAMATANSDTIKTALDDKDLKTVSSNKFGETSYVLLNVAQGAADPKGDNAKSPLLQLPCRQALAAAIDRDRYSQERGGGGIASPADGPYPKGSLGYLPDSGYPKFDIAQAQKFMDACLAATGTSSLEFTFNTTNDPFNVESVQLIAAMWTDAFGDKVKTTDTPIEQGQYIGLALNGTFQAQTWRNHSGVDPDQQRTWWTTAAAKPIGTSALNFGRFQDPIIDQALETIKINGDTAARKAAAEAINKEFGAQVWNLWLTRADSAIISQPYVNGISANKLPDGTTGIGLYGQQRHQSNQIWCDNGKCA